MMLDHSCQVQRHALADRGDDLFAALDYEPDTGDRSHAGATTIDRISWEL